MNNPYKAKLAALAVSFVTGSLGTVAQANEVQLVGVRTVNPPPPVVVKPVQKPAKKVVKKTVVHKKVVKVVPRPKPRVQPKPKIAVNPAPPRPPVQPPQTCAKTSRVTSCTPNICQSSTAHVISKHLGQSNRVSPPLPL